MMIPYAEAVEQDKIAEVLKVKEGMVVADVGAGKGEWTVDLARRVGTTGRVYSTEIDAESLKDIEQAVGRAGLENVTLIEGVATDTNLPEQCCNAILLRRVYHHMTNPHEMDRSMFESLRPGGLILVIEKAGGGHGTPTNQLIEEMIANGFELVRHIDDWSSRDDAMLFRRPE